MPEKYKNEIEEIFKRAGEAAPSRSADKSERHPEDRPRGRESMVSRNASVSRSRLSQSRPSITPGKLMLIGVITLMVGRRVLLHLPKASNGFLYVASNVN